VVTVATPLPLKLMGAVPDKNSIPDGITIFVFIKEVFPEKEMVPVGETTYPCSKTLSPEKEIVPEETNTFPLLITVVPEKEIVPEGTMVTEVEPLLNVNGALPDSVTFPEGVITTFFCKEIEIIPTKEIEPVGLIV